MKTKKRVLRATVDTIHHAAMEKTPDGSCRFHENDFDWMGFDFVSRDFNSTDEFETFLRCELRKHEIPVESMNIYPWNQEYRNASKETMCREIQKNVIENGGKHQRSSA